MIFVHVQYMYHTLTQKIVTYIVHVHVHVVQIQKEIAEFIFI